jgi:hypothetical protein
MIGMLAQMPRETVTSDSDQWNTALKLYVSHKSYRLLHRRVAMVTECKCYCIDALRPP